MASKTRRGSNWAKREYQTALKRLMQDKCIYFDQLSTFSKRNKTLEEFGKVAGGENRQIDDFKFVRLLSLSAVAFDSGFLNNDKSIEHRGFHFNQRALEDAVFRRLKNTDGEGVNWLKICWMQFLKTGPCKINRRENYLLKFEGPEPLFSTHTLTIREHTDFNEIWHYKFGASVIQSELMDRERSTIGNLVLMPIVAYIAQLHIHACSMIASVVHRKIDHVDPPIVPSKVLMVIRVKPWKGNPYWEKNILSHLGFEERKNEPVFLKNIPEICAMLWRVKHLVKIIPLTVDDFTTYYIHENGTIHDTGKLDPARYQATMEAKNNTKKMNHYTIREQLRLRWLKGNLI
ncbi:39S ribosomal protein L30, mitochondrial [Melipona quadrifasciata]|uniref:Large ribosomal subunit protein uL30m n=1 Tax=Melipona quadrifasciata TaxID=166423 RepID=A0A0M8ZUL7_9HYME|nr:39S ribosomal protein L30, mitochondrial [Melipona quadrifasciata]